MTEKRGSFENRLSRRLPPPEAWRHPEQWLNLQTGYIRSDIQRFAVETDENGFVAPHDAFAAVQSLFWEDYEWEIDNSDPELKPDRHHFHYEREKYLPENNNGNVYPILFRELPNNIGYMPRAFHNVWHDVTSEPRMPQIDAMTELVEGYIPARYAFVKLLTAARQTTKVQREFGLRKSDVAQHPERINYQAYDVRGEAYLRDSFKTHHTSFKQAQEELLDTPKRELIYPNDEHLKKMKPHIAVAKLGRFVTNESINFLPYFSVKVAV